MISVAEARNIIHANIRRQPAIIINIEEAEGKILREPIAADRDFPPFDRVMMDGIAINYEKTKGIEAYPIENIQYAGGPPLTLGDFKNCMEVMTGATLPYGTDTVIPYEQISIHEKNGKKTADITTESIKYGQNIQTKGLEQMKGDTLVSEGTLMGPAELAVAASVGKKEFKVAKPPSIAVIATGNELVGIENTPEPYQIRMSNTYALKNALKAFDIQADHFHIRDEKQELNHQLNSIFGQYEVLILSGGVSRGKADLVPEVLDELGVHALFHKVAQKPGKPFWFGNNKNGNTIFALPGNPVSTFVCFYQYILPWIRSSMGAKPIRPLLAKLDKPINFAKSMTYFLQVRIITDHNGNFVAEPVEGKGSGDFVNLVNADGFLELPPDQSQFKAGEVYYLTLYRNLSNI